MNLNNHRGKALISMVAVLTLSLGIIGLEAVVGNATPPSDPATLMQSDDGSGISIYLFLQIDGNVIEGESTVASLGRENSIQIDSFNQEMARTGGRIEHKHIVFTKVIDKASPLLFKALSSDETVDSAEFRFFKPSASGAGVEEHFYTIKIESGKVESMITFTGSNDPYYFEEISISFQEITWTDEINGATHTDSLRTP
ncbi:MAG: type VI secretion system tube protein Hcp [Candidatus Aminicenantes bacterium]